MPLRIGPNGAVVKPSSYTKGQRTIKPTASNVIDLTGESSEDAPGNNSGDEEESEDDRGRKRQESRAGKQGRTSRAGDLHKRVVTGPRINDRQRVARRAQEYILEDSFIVTSLHHRPWGAGDDNTTIGVFSTEREAKAAANVHFEQRCVNMVDGWQSKWYRRPGDGMLQLRGVIDEGERDSETYTASIEPFQQKRPARRAQECILEDSFVVTSLHHRPWGAGNHNTTIGAFPTEREARAAASRDFERCARQADGWESKWYRRPGDDMLQLRGIIEEGERDSETYTASIERVQQK